MEHNSIEKMEMWVGPKVIQEYFQMSKGTFEKLFRRGMPCLRIGKSRRFKISEVEQWLKEQNERS